MKLGYNTNGLMDHSLSSAIELLSDVGYDCIAITLDHHRLNPYGPSLREELNVVKAELDEAQLTSVIETGARYLLDSYHKHQPTLLTTHPESRQVRIDFLCRAIDIASALDSTCVSFWSGTNLSDAPRQATLRQLCDSLRPVVDHAVQQEVTLAFEPEPGHFIDTMASFEELLECLPTDYAEQLKLTIDIGHLHCLGELPISEYLLKWRERLANVHIDDMERGVHEHLRLGYGRVDFGDAMSALAQMSYQGPATVELPRYSHCGPEVVEESYRYINDLLLNMNC